MAVIIDYGMREMLVEQKDVFYYVTLMNENYAQPDLPEGAAADVIRGCYRFAQVPAQGQEAGRVTLMGSGAILGEVIKAAQLLAAQGIASDVFSVTSWSELARDGHALEQQAMNAAGQAPVLRSVEARAARSSRAPASFVTTQLAASAGPVIAATDYVRAVPESIRAYVPEGRRYVTLGTDGFGRSDTRAALREFFGVDAQAIVRAALYAL
jgi:pyruvate dehydrogenase E1 component